MNDRPFDRLIKIEDVMKQVGMGKTKIYDLLQLEDFPAPVKLGRYSRWSQVEIQDWIELQKKNRAA